MQISLNVPTEQEKRGSSSIYQSTSLFSRAFSLELKIGIQFNEYREAVRDFHIYCSPSGMFGKLKPYPW